MHENRARKYHQERIGEALREEITSIVQGELADPRIGSAVVSEVHLAPDGKSAHVFFFVEGDDEKEADDTMRGLMSAKSYIRREVAQRLGLRHPPELIFQLDRSQQYGTRIEELLGRLQKRSGRDTSRNT